VSYQQYLFPRQTTGLLSVEFEAAIDVVAAQAPTTTTTFNKSPFMRQLSRKFSRQLWRNAKVSSPDMHATHGSLFYQIAARKARHSKIVSSEGLQWRPGAVHLRISGIFLPLCTAIYAVCQGWRLIMSRLSLVESGPCAV
jgi:hypothetical protein